VGMDDFYNEQKLEREKAVTNDSKFPDDSNSEQGVDEYPEPKKLPKIPGKDGVNLEVGKVISAYRGNPSKERKLK